jgi:hypothetical protein
VISARSGSSIVPFVTGGVKWFARNHRWGLRGDYRLIAA